MSKQNITTEVTLEQLQEKLLTDFLRSPEIKEKELSLTKLESKYWNLMKARSGVPYLRGPVGTAKSAIASTIAKKLGLGFIDLRLGSADETDLGSYPYAIKDDETGKFYVDHLGNSWAISANSRPTIIAIEELNRTRKPVQDAALQLLNERRVGNIQLNENVFMIASGNLGDEDGTEVNELDAAANNRCFHIKHHLTLDQWYEGFAKDNILPDIWSFLNSHPVVLTEKPQTNQEDITSGGFGTYRSWTNVNNFIVMNGLDLYDAHDILILHDMACSCVGVSGATKLKKWLDERRSINIQTILNNFDAVEAQVLNLNRIQKSDLLVDLRKKNIFKIKDSEWKNAVKFLCTIDDDELSGELFKLATEIEPAMLRNKPPRLIELTETHEILAPRFKKMRDISLSV